MCLEACEVWRQFKVAYAMGETERYRDMTDGPNVTGQLILCLPPSCTPGAGPTPRVQLRSGLHRCPDIPARTPKASTSISRCLSCAYTLDQMIAVFCIRPGLACKASRQTSANTDSRRLSCSGLRFSSLLGVVGFRAQCMSESSWCRIQY